MKLNNTYLYLLFSLLVFQSYGQDREIKTADKNYDAYSFVNAIAIYEQIAEDGYRSKEVLEKLGNAYYYNADLPSASKWYGELMKLGETLAPEYYFRYAQALKSEERYKESDAMMKKFNSLTTEIRGTVFNNTPNYLEEIALQSGRYRIENLSDNSNYSDFAPSFYGDQLVFSSARDTGRVTKNRHTWNDKPFLDLFGAEIEENGAVTSSDKFSRKLNTQYHESTSVFTKDGNTMYFTRNNYYKGKYKNDEAGINKLKLFRAKRDGNRWIDIEELPFNSNEYSVAHPALSVDEKELYFASDMPGTTGLSDLYKVEIKADGSFGEPMNLGKGINTEGRETFPFISKKNELYFASDGHVGLGGLDVFVINMEMNDEETIIYNVGEPVNSPVDDFTFIIDSDTSKGYFASNREGGKGDDDIYSFIETKPIVWTCEQEIAGVVKDEKTNEPLSGASVILYDAANKELESTYSDDKGNFRFKAILACNEVYFVRGSKKDYNKAEVLLPKQAEAGLREATLLLEKEEVPFEVGDDLAVHLNIPMIYFDFDKYNIRQDAAVELAKVIAVMKQYPTLKVDVRSHTDSRGTDSYNLKLSKNRNLSTRNYIISQGIDASRLTGDGYGETRPVNQCSNGVKCSDEEHQLNRRSEFIIVEK